MNQFLITIPDGKTAEFLAFVKNLNFNIKIGHVEKQNDLFRKSGNKKYDDFKELFGIWEDSDVTLEKIREKAWPKKAI